MLVAVCPNEMIVAHILTCTYTCTSPEAVFLARSQLGTRYIGRILGTSCPAWNELVPRLTKNTASDPTYFHVVPGIEKFIACAIILSLGLIVL